MEEEQPKNRGNICDIICNTAIGIMNEEELMTGYFEGGSIYLGRKEAIGESIYQKNIGAVVTVMDKKSYQKQRILERLTQAGLEGSHLFIDTKDSKEAQIKSFYEPTYEFISKQLNEGKNVLVHCKGGMSRSPAILCSYLMRKYHLSYDNCNQLLKKRRNVVKINEGFQSQLKEYSALLKEKKQ